MKFRIVVPHRDGFDGMWVPGKFLPDGVNTVELPEKFKPHPDSAEVPMLDILAESKNLGLTVVAYGDSLDLILSAEAASAASPDTTPPAVPPVTEPNPGRKLRG